MRALNPIKKILLTEKGSRLTEGHNQYVFEVNRNANKVDIKYAIERQFKVRVKHVNTMIRQGKRKRERTMQYGMTPHWKRAVVTLREGDSIDLT